MGKGDRKSKKGKLFKGSYGKTRPRPVKDTNISSEAKTPSSSHQ